MKRLLIFCLSCLLLAGCGARSEPVYDEPVLVQTEAYILWDGTQVDVWQTEILGHTIYQTPDGVELLRIPEQADIANVHVWGVDNFGTLSETVQEKIRAYYADNWPELDIQELLEKAWSEFCRADQETPFSGYFASQSIFPCTANDTIIVYCVESMIPIDGSTVQYVYFDTVFDSRTGEVIDVWDLFSVSREQAADVMARKLATDDSQYLEIKAALETNAVIRVIPGCIEILFPQGTLSGSEYDHYMALGCTELEEILYGWAVTEIVDE